MGWHGDEGVIEAEERGEEGDGGRVTLLQSFSVNVICPLIAHSGGTE